MAFLVCGEMLMFSAFYTPLELLKSTGVAHPTINTR